MSDTSSFIPRIEIARDNFLIMSDDLLETQARILVVRGDEGFGKSTFLRQFARRHEGNAISIFIEPLSRYAYDTQTVANELAYQAYQLLGDSKKSNGGVHDPELTRILLPKLHKRAKNRDELIYFVVDGFSEIPSEDSTFRTALIELLPWGFSNFRFICSETSDCGFPKKGRLELALSGFTLDESSRFLADLGLNSGQLNEVHRACKGIPHRLETVRRLIRHGSEVESLISSLSARSTDLFRLEWAGVQDQSHLHLPLAIITFQHYPISLEELSRICKTDTDQLRADLLKVSFIERADIDRPAFVKTAPIGALRQQLKHLKQTALQKLTASLLEHPDSQRASESAPRYLQESNRHDELIEFLSPDHFKKLVQEKKTLAVMQSRAAMGAQAATQCKRDADLVRFCLHQTSSVGLAAADLWQAEIEARVAIGDDDTAIRLARSAPLMEDRLALLASIARLQREQNRQIDDEVSQEISRLAGDFDPSAMGERAIEVARDLLSVNASVAIELIERSQKAKDVRHRDWAFAKLALLAQDEQGRGWLAKETEETILGKIATPDLRTAWSTLPLLIREFSAEELLNELRNIDNTDARLWIVFGWTDRNKRREDAHKVTDFGLKESIQNVRAAHTARFLAGLAAPLPYVKDAAIRSRLIASFDTQVSFAAELGPMDEVIKLRLILAKATAVTDSAGSLTRLTDTYLEVLEIKDLATKLSGVALVLGSLDELDPDRALESRDKIHSWATKEFTNLASTLLNSSAEHVAVARPVLNALANKKPDLAIDLCSALNTEERRDEAFQYLAKKLAAANSARVRFDLVLRTFDSIFSDERRDSTALQIVERLTSNLKHGKEALDCIELILSKTTDLSKRTQILALMYRFAKQQKDQVCDPDKIKLNLLASWKELDFAFGSAERGFNIAKTIAKEDPETARILILECERMRDQTPLGSTRRENVFMSTIGLLIRGYSGLFRKQLDSDEDLDRLSYLIDFLPLADRIAAWSEVAFRYSAVGRNDKCAFLVNTHILPNLAPLEHNKATYRQVLIVASPAIYRSSRDIAHKHLGREPRHVANEAYSYIAKGILRHAYPFDPFEHRSATGFNITYGEALEIIDILNHISADDLFYEIASDLCDSILGSSESRFDRKSAADIGQQLETIARKKLPDSRGIKHDGFLLLALAEVARLSRDESAFDSIIAKAVTVPNLADRAFVLIRLASILPSRSRSKFSELVRRIVETIDSIPASIDKCSRIRFLAEEVSRVDGTIVRKYLREAMSLAVKGTNRLFYEERRDLVDIAYRIEPEFAEALAREVDDDPAHDVARSEIQTRLSVLKLRAESGQQKLTDDDDRSIEILANGCWLALGSLNANRIQAWARDRSHAAIHRAASAPLSVSYPIFALAIESLVRNYSNNQQALSILRPVVDGLFISTELAAELAVRSAGDIDFARNLPADNDEGILVEPGDREFGLSYLEKSIKNLEPKNLLVCDPYFTTEDLRSLGRIALQIPDISIQILTSHAHQKKKVAEPFEESYRRCWRDNFDTSPPDIDIVLLGTERSDHFPIHDRWWLCELGGIRLGTSFGSVGAKRWSDISLLSKEEASRHRAVVESFIRRTVRIHDGERLVSSRFSL